MLQKTNYIEQAGLVLIGLAVYDLITADGDSCDKSLVEAFAKPDDFSCIFFIDFGAVLVIGCVYFLVKLQQISGKIWNSVFLMFLFVSLSLLISLLESVQTVGVFVFGTLFIASAGFLEDKEASKLTPNYEDE